jgi:hypothetical protein
VLPDSAIAYTVPLGTHENAGVGLYVVARAGVAKVLIMTVARPAAAADSHLRRAMSSAPVVGCREPPSGRPGCRQAVRGAVGQTARL